MKEHDEKNQNNDHEISPSGILGGNDVSLSMKWHFDKALAKTVNVKSRSACLATILPSVLCKYAVF